ncbi:hypothetical protein DM01DRAFT_1339136 [Hesseltinella vesiculosa]|uniref:Uncharacterized protein n=1 Tax=Hesseltinella vesiculosa TaxID=101127 RepID=A0A1X2G9D3_9FUNG|nr:hypothetical protein DM01DRAFT_1339136 [Hesseltinella vesiculosa]
MISRDQAICLLFCEEYNEGNAARLRKRIEDMKDFEICYENDPQDPVLIHLRLWHAKAFKYKRYE